MTTARTDSLIDRLRLLQTKLIDESTRTEPVSPFHDLLTASVRDRLSNDEFSKVQAAWQTENYRLRAVRQNEATVKSVTLANQRLTRFADIVALPVKAYTAYKTSDFQAAFNASVQSIENDSYLVEHEGCEILEYHKIQQLHNVARVYFKQGRLTEGSQVVNEALNFMANHISPTIGSQWSTSALINFEPFFRSMMMHQLIGESLHVFLHYPSLVEQLSESSFRSLNDLVPVTRQEHMISQWFAMPLKEPHVIFSIDDLLDFLEKTDGRSTDIFRFSASVSALEFMNLSTGVLAKLCQFITMLNVPDQLKTIWQSNSYQRNLTTN